MSTIVLASIIKYPLQFFASGQYSEEEILSNNRESEHFTEFLSILGEKVRLKGKLRRFVIFSGNHRNILSIVTVLIQNLYVRAFKIFVFLLACPIRLSIFSLFSNEPELCTEINPSMAMTPFPSSILGRDSNPQPYDHESNLLTTRPDQCP